MYPLFQIIESFGVIVEDVVFVLLGQRGKQTFQQSDDVTEIYFVDLLAHIVPFSRKYLSI